MRCPSRGWAGNKREDNCNVQLSTLNLLTRMVTVFERLRLRLRKVSISPNPNPNPNLNLNQIEVSDKKRKSA